MLFGDALSLLARCSDNDRTDPEDGLTCPKRWSIHKEEKCSSQRLDINSAPGTLLQAAIAPGNQRKAPVIPKPGPALLYTRPPGTFQPSLPQQQQHAQQQPPPQPQPPQPQPPQAQQPQAHARWQGVDLPLQKTVLFTMFVSAVCLAAGYWHNFDHPTVAGGRLYNYAGPAFWLSAALFLLPGFIAGWNRVANAEVQSRVWIGVAVVALLSQLYNMSSSQTPPQSQEHQPHTHSQCYVSERNLPGCWVVADLEGPQSQEQHQLHTYPPLPHESSQHSPSSPSPSPSSPSPSPSSPSPSPSSSSPSESPQVQQLQQQLEQQEHQQEQQEQPQAHAGWQRTDLGLQLAACAPFAFSLHAIFLGAGLVLTWKGRTVPGRRLKDYVGPSFWILGALLSFPRLIVPGTESTALGWLAVAMAALVLGIVSTVGNMVFASQGHG
ncbi:hypothetical protein L198_07398 [Cryptococcus wingfieldii CBS 7118]|uniref:Uncharacterized protein n=1 Tax=Cryptococcus wingfieldii CBS 7118 TaxID=1295528 RepID=A0A1E3ICD7_9TREE|nr:hypothetical protein L198_07398 [Cryptococcus wingfieldii CBS 7118]ODN86105.1 hypothetical protein L198_07398 [Cryptococcus wingfieldii CBS 7118]